MEVLFDGKPADHSALHIPAPDCWTYKTGTRDNTPWEKRSKSIATSLSAIVSSITSPSRDITETVPGEPENLIGGRHM
jgi:hypothetical protein